MNTRISLLLGMILMALPAIAQESGWIGISISSSIGKMWPACFS